MITLENYIINEQIDNILEEINDENINEGKVTKAIKKFWQWLFGNKTDSTNFSYKGSKFGYFPDNLEDEEIKNKLSNQTYDYIDFTEIHTKSVNTNAIDFIKSLINTYPGQFAYLEDLFKNVNSILNLLSSSDDVHLGVLKCFDPFNDDQKNKKILISAICLYVYDLSNINIKAYEKIKKYAESDEYHKYAYIIAIDVMKNCKSDSSDFHLEKQLYNKIIKHITTKTYGTATFSGISTVVYTDTDNGKKIKDLFIQNLSFNTIDKKEKSGSKEFLYKSNI